MFHLPPLSTLFPYTTLFRSRVGWLEVCRPGPRRPNFDIFRGRLAELGYVEGKNLIIEQRFADCRYDRMPAKRDRKSTRLNSSHVSISYAVFCLKKKNWVRSS